MTNEEINYTPYPGVEAEDMQSLTELVKEIEQGTQASKEKEILNDETMKELTGQTDKEYNEQCESEPIKASQIEQEPEPVTQEPVKTDERTEIINGDPLTLDQELKIIKALTKLFPDGEMLPEDELINFEFLSIVDPAHVCMVTGKNKIANKILSKFYTGNSPKVPNLNYSDQKIRNGSKFALDYLQIIMDVFKPFQTRKSYDLEPINIIVGEDSPLIISNEYFSFLLAPRIEAE